MKRRPHRRRAPYPTREGMPHAPRGAPRQEPAPAEASESEHEEPGLDDSNSSDSLAQVIAIVGKELGAAARMGRPYDADLLRKARSVVSGSLIFRAELDELLRHYQRARVLKVKRDAVAAVEAAKAQAAGMTSNAAKPLAVPAPADGKGSRLH